jgi:ketosteroid isomerase-like protein
MSIEIVKQFHALAGGGQFAEALALFADDAVIEFHGPASIPLAGRHVGRAAIGKFFATIGSALEIEHFEASEFIDGGSSVVVLGRERSRVKATGRVFDVPWVQVWRSNGQQLTALSDFFDTGSMAQAFVQAA